MYSFHYFVYLAQLFLDWILVMIVSESGYEYPDRLHAHSLSFFLSLAMQQ